MKLPANCLEWGCIKFSFSQGSRPLITRCATTDHYDLLVRWLLGVSCVKEPRIIDEGGDAYGEFVDLMKYF